MNRTDRLYALVEELRRVAPRPRSAPWLARHFEVSVRTIERDLDALRQAGVPIWAQNGRTGGYTVDRKLTLPPLALTDSEALALGLALRSVDRSPFADAARTAGHKVLASVPESVRERERALLARVHEVGPVPVPADPAVLRAVERSVAEGRVVHLVYRAETGSSERDIEPMGLLRGPRGWYLLGWCRLRGAVRGFRLDAITRIRLLDEIAPTRDDALRAELARIDARGLADRPRPAMR